MTVAMIPMPMELTSGRVNSELAKIPL